MAGRARFALSPSRHSFVLTEAEVLHKVRFVTGHFTGTSDRLFQTCFSDTDAGQEGSMEPSLAECLFDDRSLRIGIAPALLDDSRTPGSASSGGDSVNA